MRVNDDQDRDSMGLSASMPETIEVRHLFDMHVNLAPVQLIPSPGGNRMIFVVEGGTIEGERMRGELLPGGGDWLLVGTDGVARIDVRATIRTDDDELVYMTNRGIVALGNDYMQRFAQGEDVTWDQGYIRSAPLFEAAAERYAWLNTTMTVAVNEIGPGYVNYRIFSVR